MTDNHKAERISSRLIKLAAGVLFALVTGVAGNFLYDRIKSDALVAKLEARFNAKGPVSVPLSTNSIPKRDPELPDSNSAPPRSPPPKLSDSTSSLGRDSARAAPAHPWPRSAITKHLTPESGKDIWVTSVYSYLDGPSRGPGGGLDNEYLRVGGWGDYYLALIRFDLAGLPAPASFAAIYLYAIRDGDTSTSRMPVSMYVDRVTSPWDWAPDDRLWWAKRPKVEPLITTALPAPVPNQWYRIEITELYNAWKQGTYPNFGVQLRPASVNNRFNKFVSSNEIHSTHLRPVLAVAQ